MHRCTNADSKTTAIGAYDASVDVYRDELAGSYDATQLRHQEMNAIQEEIANVIRANGIALNSDTETPAQMVQLSSAISQRAIHRGYIDGAILSWETAGETISVGNGELSFDAGGGVLVLRKFTGFRKVLLNVGGGSLKAWTAGVDGGMVPSGCLSLWNTITADYTATELKIKNASSTANIVADTINGAGDLIINPSDHFSSSRYLKCWNKTSSVVDLFAVCNSTQTSQTITLKFRWYYVFALAKSADGMYGTNIEFAVDENANGTHLSAIGSGWDLKRIVGAVLVQNTAGVYQIIKFKQYGDEFYFGDGINPVYFKDPALTSTPEEISLLMPSGLDSIYSIGQCIFENTATDNTAVIWDKDFGSAPVVPQVAMSIKGGAKIHLTGLKIFGDIWGVAYAGKSLSGTNDNLTIYAQGYRMKRGRDY